MGICTSCLGLRQNSDVEQSETSRLLSDDPYRGHYGSHGPNGSRPVHQPDPEFLRREREALKGIAHAMSDNVVDVFTILPSNRGPEDRPASQSPEPYVNGVDHEVTPQEKKYKSIKRGKVGAIASKAGVEDGNRRAAKAAMG